MELAGCPCRNNVLSGLCRLRSPRSKAAPGSIPEPTITTLVLSDEPSGLAENLSCSGQAAWSWSRRALSVQVYPHPQSSVPSPPCRVLEVSERAGNREFHERHSASLFSFYSRFITSWASGRQACTSWPPISGSLRHLGHDINSARPPRAWK